TCSNTNRLCASFASCLTCSIIARSVGVPSSVTRIVSYMVVPFVGSASSADDDLPRRFQRVRQAKNVHRGDQNSTAPTGNQKEPAVLPSPHALAGAGEVQQWEHGERKLQGQHDLA